MRWHKFMDKVIVADRCILNCIAKKRFHCDKIIEGKFQGLESPGLLRT